MNGLPLLLILWLIVGLLGKMKKAPAARSAKPAGRAKPASQAGGSQAVPLSPRQQRQAAAQQRPAQQEAPAADAHHSSVPFQAHMHQPVMDAEGEGTEGIDCCHDFMVGNPSREDTPDFLTVIDEDNQARAKALLQGVVFSEILNRPHRRFGGRHA